MVMALESNKERKMRQKQSYHAEWNKKRHSAGTPGKSKNIIATALQKGVCKRNRSWKRPDYEVVMASLGRKSCK